jgi:pimeloyl-ACP methyl ester carboxylesterase
VLLTGALLDGCASPAARFLDGAVTRGFTIAAPAAADALAPVIVRKGTPRAGAPLHVYLDGDGSPWRSRRQPAMDPSARDPLVLDLMQRDPSAAVLVGRPCYYRDKPACDAGAWTARRYAEDIVARMAAAIEQEIAAVPNSPVTLIGYSGGGALAMLIAPRLSRVEGVVTVAANLDVAAWAADHGYAPLLGSLDPALQPPLPTRIRQYHFFGAEDGNVRAASMLPIARRERAAVEVVDGFDHRCCWREDWPALLARALTDGSAAPPALR